MGCWVNVKPLPLQNSQPPRDLNVPAPDRAVYLVSHTDGINLRPPNQAANEVSVSAWRHPQDVLINQSCNYQAYVSVVTLYYRVWHGWEEIGASPNSLSSFWNWRLVLNCISHRFKNDHAWDSNPCPQQLDTHRTWKDNAYDVHRNWLLFSEVAKYWRSN